MASNPFNPSATANPVDQQSIRRERVKVTVYAVLGVMVVFCLTLLFQGCRHQPAAADIPEESLPAASRMENTAPAVQPAAPAAAPAPASDPAPALANSNQPAADAVASSPTPVVEPVAAAPMPVVASSPAESVGKPVAADPASSVYVIKRGDSLTRIAKAHGTTVQALKAANQLTSDRILVGKTLKIPVTQS